MTEDPPDTRDRVEADSLLKVLEWEYHAIKSEQTQRIGFRDNMLFVHLAAVGGVVSWSLTHADGPYGLQSLLVVPWICAVLGWTYLVNDHAVSRMGRYTRQVLTPRASPLASPTSVTVREDDGTSHTISEVFGWEPFHRIDTRRRSRKVIQLAVDVLTFVLPGVGALIVYWRFAEHVHPALTYSVIFLESTMLVGLAFAILVYADLGKG